MAKILIINDYEVKNINKFSTSGIETLKSQSIKRNNFTVNNFKNNLYIIGGQDNDNNIYSKVDLLNISTNKWINDIELIEPVSKHKTSVMNKITNKEYTQDAIILTNGYNTSDNITSSTQYYLNQNKFVQLDIVKGIYSENYSNDKSITNSSVINFNDKIYKIAGIDAYSHRIENKVQYWDLSSNDRWRETFYINQPRYNSPIINFRNRIYIVGGIIDNNLTPTNSVECLKLDSHDWELSSLIIKRKNHKIINYKNNLYAIGGKNHNNQAVESVEIYNEDLNTWSSSSNMNVKRYDFEILIISDPLLILAIFNSNLVLGITAPGGA